MNEPDLFAEALARTDPAERTAFLDETCAGKPELRRRLEDLLAAETRADSPPTEAGGAGVTVEPSTAADTVEHQPHEPSETVDRPGGGATTAGAEPRGDATVTMAPADPDATSAFAASHPPTATKHPRGEGLGAVIAGRYTLVEVIGEGGMGSVYLARQTEPVKRQVALKLIKSGMDSRSVLARFDAERQALALMDHPNIARIYDGGVTPTGQPFFVMELVDGVPLTQYCDRKRLPVRDRLALFVPVCQAVQHAHQKGIIHRDLKPGNVLVTEVDGRATPKVIDFGVAKATEQDLTDLSLADTDAIVGTPTYMSPEQADPSSMDIDTRTDVYALGVMLYELLTGSPPLDARQFKRGALLEMLRMVREVDPPRPSTKLSSAEALPSIAANRGTEPARLSRLLRGELDWVVMKALEKDRNRRYETANGLARDLQRYLADEMVEARPPSRGYRLKTFVKRNRGQVIAAGLIFLTLVGGVIGTGIGLFKADRALRAEETQRRIAVDQKRKAEASEAVAKGQRARAEQRERLAIDAVKKFRDAVADSHALKNDPALDPLRKALLKEPLAFFSSLRGSLQADADTDPESVVRLADAAHDYAHITEEIGDREDGLKGHAESRALWERLARDDPRNAAYQAGLAKIDFCRGKLLEDTGRPDEAERSYDSALAIYESLTRADPRNADLRRLFALSLLRRGGMFRDRDKPAEAMKAYESAAALLEGLIGDPSVDPDAVPGYRSDLAGTHVNIGVLQGITGRPDEALVSFGKALPVWRDLARDFPDDVDAQKNLGDIYEAIGTFQTQAGKRAEAMTSLESALEVWKGLTALHPSVTDFQNGLAKTYMQMARLQPRPEALASQEKAVAIWTRLAEAHPTVGDFRSNLAGVLSNMGAVQHNEATALWAAGDTAGAMAFYQKAVANTEAALRNDGSNLQARVNLSKHHWDVGKLLAETGKPAEALEPSRKALAIRKALVDEHPDDGLLKTVADYHNGIGILEQGLGKTAEAMASYDQCRAIGERLVRDHPESPEFVCCLSGALSNMAEIDIDAKRFAEARDRLRQAVALQKKALAAAPEHPTCRRYLAIHLDLLVKTARELGRADEAAEAQRDLDDLKAGDKRPGAPKP